MVRLVALEHTAESLRCELRDTEETFMNMLKRALTDVQVLAPTRVTFRTNTSCFADDAIAHRVGLLPVRSVDTEPFVATLRAKGPTVVTAAALGERFVSPYSLIVALNEGEELDCDLHIGLGTGKAHARHAAAVASRFYRRHVGFERSAECFCPRVEVGARCDMCAAVKGEGELVFTLEFETTGALTPLELLRRSWRCVLAEAEGAARQLGELEATPVEQTSGQTSEQSVRETALDASAQASIF